MFSPKVTKNPALTEYPPRKLWPAEREINVEVKALGHEYVWLERAKVGIKDQDFVNLFEPKMADYDEKLTAPFHERWQICDDFCTIQDNEELAKTNS